MLVGPPEVPARCVVCGCEMAFGQIPFHDYLALRDDYYIRHFTEELRMLEKVEEFYSRCGPKALAIVPHFKRVLDSDDPHVKRQRAAGVPFDEIQLPPQPELELMDPADQEVINYLQHNSFNLNSRIQFVRESLDELRKSIRAVPCPRCADGTLRLIE